MMKPLKLTLFYLLGLAIVLQFSACKKDNNDPGIPQAFPAGCQLMSYTVIFSSFSTELKNDYTFDGDNLLLAAQVYVNDELTGRRTYQRDSRNRIIQINRFDEFGDLEGYDKISYDGDSERLMRVDFYDVENGGIEILNDYLIYEHEGNRIQKVTRFESDGSENSRITYEIDDESNKVITREYDADGILYERRILTLNPERPNPFLSVSAVTYFLTEATIKVDTYDESGELDLGSSYSVIYDDDEVNETLNMQYVYLDGDITTYNMSYNCN